MATQTALVVQGPGKPFTLTTVPIPIAGPGAAIIKPLCSGIVPYTTEILKGPNGPRPYPLSHPLIFGTSCVGRVDSVGPDATVLTPGQLVFVDSLVRARDEAENVMMQGFHGGAGPGARKLMDGEWRDGTYAQYVKVPLENCHVVDEARVVRELGWTHAELCAVLYAMPAFGGLSEGGVKPGDSVVVTPATGTFGGCAVGLALALGAVVVAAGRNEVALERLGAAFASTGRLRTVKLHGDVATDTEAFRIAAGRAKGADFFVDFSPPQAAGGSHIAAGIMALRSGGTCILQGGIRANEPIPYGLVMHRGLRIQGKYMCTPQEIRQMIHLLEAGIVNKAHVGAVDVSPFALHDWENAVRYAADNASWGNLSVFEMEKE